MVSKAFSDMVIKDLNLIIRCFELMLEPGMVLFIHYDLRKAYTRNIKGELIVVGFAPALLVSERLRESNHGIRDDGSWKSFKIKTLDSVYEEETEKLYFDLSDEERGWIKLA